MDNSFSMKGDLPATLEDSHALIKELLSVVKTLTEKINELTEKLSLNSTNSSLPPSQDWRSKKKDKRPPSNRSSGGQPGHTGHHRPLLDSSEVDHIVKCILPTHCACGEKLILKEAIQRHQVYELPKIKLDITEYQLEKGYCATCQCHQVAPLPTGITWGITGHHLTTFMLHLVSKYQMPRRALQGFLKEHFNFKLSLGSVFNKQRLLNTLLETPVEALLAEVKTAPNVNADETGHKRDGKKECLWNLASKDTVYLSIEKSRVKKILKALLGDYQGVVTSDRYAAYNLFESSERQLCWAHLKRDFQVRHEVAKQIVSTVYHAVRNLLFRQQFPTWTCDRSNAMV